jgi:hypothetical protein
MTDRYDPFVLAQIIGNAMADYYGESGHQPVAMNELHRALGNAVSAYLRQNDASLLKRYEDALHKLSKLGNGEYLGNSDGNIIAQNALNH